MNRQNLNYEELYDRLYERGLILHKNNKKRIRTGLIFLAVFTVAMIFIRWLTDSDRVVFMVIWVIGMFAISIYLVSVEYIDSSVQKALEEVTERETGFGELLPDPENMREKLYERLMERREEIETHYVGHWRTGREDRDQYADADQPAEAGEPVISIPDPAEEEREDAE